MEHEFKTLCQTASSDDKELKQFAVVQKLNERSNERTVFHVVCGYEHLFHYKEIDAQSSINP